MAALTTLELSDLTSIHESLLCTVVTGDAFLWVFLLLTTVATVMMGEAGAGGVMVYLALVFSCIPGMDVPAPIDDFLLLATKTS